MGGFIKAGVARVNITPAVGQVIYVGREISKGVGDEFYAQAIVFDDGSERAVIVTADVIIFGKETVEKIRRKVEVLTGIKGQNVMLAASHTHSGTPTTAWLSEQVSETYLSGLVDKIAGAVFQADAGKQEVLIGAGSGEAKVSINRWIPTPDGPTGARWGPNPEGPVDHAVDVLRVDNNAGGPMAVLVNYAAHASVLGDRDKVYSSDYPGVVRDVIERIYYDATAMFTSGAGGDIKIASLKEDGSDFKYGDREDMRCFGTIIAAEAIKVAEGRQTRAIDGLKLSSASDELPLCDPPGVAEVEAEYIKLSQAVKEDQKKGKKFNWGQHRRLIWAEKTLEALKNGIVMKSVPGEVQVLRLGDEAVFVAVPGELFAEVGLRIKKLAGGEGRPRAFVIAYANEYVGYLPSAISCREDGDTPRYDWHKFLPYASTFSEEMENVLVSAVEKLL